MTYLAGKVALDIIAGAPNNGRGEDNTGVVKKLWIGREAFPLRIRAGIPQVGAWFPAGSRAPVAGDQGRTGKEAAGLHRWPA